MTKEDLNNWYKLYRQVINGYFMSSDDWHELNRLNLLIMEATHKIHNDNMLSNK